MASFLARPAMRVASRSLAQAVAARAFSSTPVPEATLREIESRLKSVKNIEKITKSMKMIATTRLARAQRAMADAKAYGETNSVVFKETEATGRTSGEEKAAGMEGKTLYIVVSSDRGLCGGIHSSVSKRARAEMAEDVGAQVVVCGDKPKQQLSRTVPNSLVLSFNQIGRELPTFADACAIADSIEERKYEFDKVKIIYNKWISALSYESAIMEVSTGEGIKNAPKFAAYEVDGDELVGDLSSFALANAIFHALVEGFATEISARRNAMDNASTNAADVIDKLKMQFNRMRQTQITNDLVDIITGASAL